MDDGPPKSYLHALRGLRGLCELILCNCLVTTPAPLSLKAMKSPSFGFAPMSGYGNSLEQPPDFSLDQIVEDERAPRKFFGGG